MSIRRDFIRSASVDTRGFSDYTAGAPEKSEQKIENASSSLEGHLINTEDEMRTVHVFFLALNKEETHDKRSSYVGYISVHSDEGHHPMFDPTCDRRC